MITVNSNGLCERLKKGIRVLEEYGFLQEKEDGISLYAVYGNEVLVERAEDFISITYDSEPHFYMALARSIGMSAGIHTIESKAKRLGFMLDCSRNAVPKPAMVKELICMLVLAGYDYLELYTEETYEVPGEPYFGYKRGRYSIAELKEIVAFAGIYGLEMVPCIQTLAHLKRLANWKPYFDHMDIDDVLLVGDERTYTLIRKCFRVCKEIFPTKRINIGSDEAYHLGRGKYTDVNGYKDKHEVYLEHMKKVFDICKEEGLEPEFWADAFYDTDKSEEEIQRIFDGTQLPIVWRYYDRDADAAREYLSRVKKYAGKVQYAGTFFKYQGFAPDNGFSQRSMDALFEAVSDCNVDDILMTAWANDGNECSVNAVIPSMWYAAQKLYPCDVNISDLIFELTGYNKEEWELSDKLNYVMPELDKQCNAEKYLLHNDFLIGLLDYNTPDHAGEIYKELLPKFKPLAKRDSRYSYLFASYEALCRILTRKATFGKRLYAAYQNKDTNAMKNLIEELALIKDDVQTFYRIFRKQWMKENKGFGFEVMDVRLGGMVGRIETVTEVLNDYLDGKTEQIYELEEERLEYFCNQLTGEEVYAPIHGDWATAYTVNLIVYS